MCTVQVLLMTDVMRRDGLLHTDRQTPPKNICRRLFTDEDGSQQRTEFLNAVHAEIEKQNRERWNFDFRTDAPLPGRYQWVPVRPLPQQPEKSDRPSKTKTQSKITDFLSQRKRHRTVDSPLAQLKYRRLEQPTTFN